MVVNITVDNGHLVMRTDDGEELWRSRNGCSSQNIETMLDMLYKKKPERLRIGVDGGLTPQQVTSLVYVVTSSPYTIKGMALEGAELLLRYDS